MTDAPTVSGEVARVKAPAQLIENSLASFAKVLPPAIDPEKFGHWAIVMMTRALNDPKQANAWSRVLHPDNEAGRLSVMSALMDAAALGLEPGREYHLVPFGGVVSGITDYKGEIRLIANACRSTVAVQLVREHDEFHMIGANIPPRHEADWFGNRGPVTGGYAYVDYGGGLFSEVVRMREAPDPEDETADSFQRHRDQSPQVKYQKAHPEKHLGPLVWDEHPEPMRVKTLVHQLRKMVPWAVERQW